MKGHEAQERRAAEHRICREALDRFLERGFDAVTIAEIAAAAGVGERTIYRYFGTKEGIVLGTAPGTFRCFVAALKQSPADLSLLDAYARVLSRILEDPEDLNIDRDRMTLLRSTPSLRTAWYAELLDFESGVAGWIAQRTGRSERDVEVLAAAAAFVAAHRIANEKWRGESMVSFGADFDRAMSILGAGLGLV